MNTSVVDADLSVRDLVIEYSSGGYPVRPIDGLSLDAAGGELVLLLGASGCGKTTLLSVLAAILTPTEGTVRVAGTDVTGLRGAALTEYRRKTVGVVFQAFNLVPSLPPSRTSWSRSAAASRRYRRSNQLLQRVNLDDRMNHRPRDYPADSNNGSRSRERSRTIRRCSSPTSRPRTSTTSRSTVC
jgi:putative ABC transport system ATP-binding protein